MLLLGERRKIYLVPGFITSIAEEGRVRPGARDLPVGVNEKRSK